MAAVVTQLATQFWPKLTANVGLAATSDALFVSDNEALAYSAVYVSSAANLVLASTPTIPQTGPGRELMIVNAHTSSVLTLQDNASVPGTLLSLNGYRHLPIGPGRSHPFTFRQNTSTWIHTGSAGDSIPEQYSANTTGTQAAATQLFAPNVLVTSAAVASSSVKMWPAIGSGARVYIYNAGANALWVWPSNEVTGQKFDAMAANSSFILAVSTGRMLCDMQSSTWASV